MFRFAEYTPGDALKMDLRTNYLDRPDIKNCNDLHRFLEALKGQCDIFVVGSAEQLIGIVPVFPLWPGVAEIAAFTSPEIIEHKREVYEVSTRLLAFLEESKGFHRIQTTVKVGNVVALKFVESLGFKLEGTLKQYNPHGGDYFLLARVSEVKNV